MTPPHEERGRMVSRYYYRRDLAARELIAPALIGAAVGLAAFYVARIIEQRTPLVAAEDRPGARRDRGPHPNISRRA